MIPRFNRDAIPVVLFSEQREEDTQRTWEILFDIRGDDRAPAGRALHVLDAPVKPRQRDDQLDAMFANRSVEFVLRVDRIERCHKRPEFPRSVLRDEELRAVWKQQAEPVATLEAESSQGRGQTVAQPFELRKAERGAL